jgi:4-hydroxythreonine-4-phosphate dehydrogenase
MNEAGFHYEGHTDLLAKLTNTRNFAMMLRCASLCVVLVTVHVPIKKVPSLVTQERVLMVVKLAHKFLKKFLKKSPTLAVAALNPHCGEGGIFGREEARVLTPAIIKAQKAGVKCSGPHPSDTLFRRATSGEFDAVICMYHDQALIPIKLLAFEWAVNITLGLPLIRTSPAHGTAYDIAWRNLADSRSLQEAIKLSAELAVGEEVEST